MPFADSLKNAHSAINYKKALFIIFTVIVIVFGLINTPFTERWNAKPEVYLYFTGVFSLSLFLVFWNIKNNVIEFNIIDLTLIIYFSYFLVYELLESSLTHFYLRDDFLSLLTAVCLYVCFKQIIKFSPDICGLIVLLIVSIELLLGFYQAFSRGLTHKPLFGHITGTFRNSGVFAIFLACCLPYVFSILDKEKKEFFNKKIIKALILGVILLIVADKSRTGLLLVFLTILFIYRKTFFRLWERYVKDRFLMKLWICCLCIIAILLLIYLKYPSFIGRYFIWKIAISMFMDKPFWGWGLAGFEKYYLYHQADYFKTHISDNIQYVNVAEEATNAFCEYLMILVRFGLVGFILFFFFLYKSLITYLKHRTPNIYPALTLLLILISSVFYYSFRVSIILAVAMLSLAEVASKIPSIRISNWGLRQLNRGLYALLLIGAVVYCEGQYQATLLWKETGKYRVKNGGYSLHLFAKAYPELRHRSNFLYNYGAILFETGYYQKSIKVMEECRRIEAGIDLLLFLGNAYQQTNNNIQAEACYKEASYMAPSRFNPKYLLVQFYLKNRMIEKALPIVKEIIRMPEKVHSEEVDNMKNEMANILLKYK
ncbi:MAG: O-antigen ligase [Mucilaginibacter sp.]|nr:O-antigen ligase [Mucilaginibacter sp.]